VTQGWKKLQNEKLHSFYSSPHYHEDQIKKDEMGMARNTHGGD
jgi:hypothetical protein